MSTTTTKHRSTIELKGCRVNQVFHDTLDKLYASMERSEAPYSGQASLTVTKEGDVITTTKKRGDGLSDESHRILSELEVLAKDICKKGNDPSKVKTELELEKEI